VVPSVLTPRALAKDADLPPSPTTAKITARDVGRTFGRGRGRGVVDALGPIDLDVADGEFVSVVGPSGCGKSTLLRIVAGLLRPSAGEVRIATDARNPAAMIFQDYGIYPWKTVAANVRLGLDIAGLPRRQADERVATWLERMRLSEFADAWPDTLSGGMRQRVAIARALAVEPEILLMDEPFAALDAQLRSLLQEELLDLCQQERRTVVFVTHSLSEAILLADRVVVMSARPGRILRTVTVPFDRPRSGALRSDPRFGELEAELWALLRGELDDGREEAHRG